MVDASGPHINAGILWKTFFDNSRDAILIVNVKSGCIIEANVQAERFFGVSQKKIIGKSYSSLLFTRELHKDGNQNIQAKITPIPQTLLEKAISTCITDGGNQEIELEIVGNQWVRSRILPIEINNNKINHIMLILTDLTEHKRIEHTLRESEQNYRNLVETTSDFIWEINNKSEYRYVSPRVRDILGYSPKEVLGKSPFDLMPPEEAERVRKEFLQIVGRQESINSLKNINLHKDGHLVTLETSGVPFYDINQTLLGYRGVDRDITLRIQAEDALRESEARYHTLIETQVDLISRYLPNMNLSYVNDAYCQFYGKKREELIGHNFLQWLPPDYRDECKKDTESLLKERRQLVRENLTYRYDGKMRWIQWIVQSITNVNNIVVEIQAVGRDITDRKLAEEAVRKSQATFHALFEYSPISLWVEDFSEVKRYIDGQKALGITNFRDYFDHNPLELAACAQLVKIVDVNQKTLELYESPTKEQFFQNLNSAFTEESYAQFEEELLALIDGNPIYEIESTNQTFTGKKIRVTIQTSIPTINRDTWGMVLVSVLDITARKQAEEALHASEEKYRMLFESSVVGVAVTDPEGHLHECNNAIATIFGYTREEYLLLFSPNLYVNPKDRELILSILAKDGVVENFETLMRRKNGTVFWSLLYIKRTSFKDSVRFLVTLIDIDQIKQAMQVLKESGDYILKLYEDALNISEMKTNLITFASHELKTPLVPIIGWADFMQHWITKGKKLDEIIGMEEITSIQNSAKRLTAIINNFLDLGRIESKRLELKVQKHQSAVLMKNAIDSVIQLALSRNITITDNIQDLEMWVDGFRVEQIFINILSNAIKYSPEGKQVRVTSEVTDDLFTIIFKDQGYGFTPEQLKDVWRPFASKKTQSKQDLLPATGIGLFITKGLVERHSGKIEISSPGPNLGTTVRITLHMHLLKDNEM